MQNYESGLTSGILVAHGACPTPSELERDSRSRRAAMRRHCGCAAPGADGDTHIRADQLLTTLERSRARRWVSQEELCTRHLVDTKPPWPAFYRPPTLCAPPTSAQLGQPGRDGRKTLHPALTSACAHRSGLSTAASRPWFAACGSRRSSHAHPDVAVEGRRLRAECWLGHRDSSWAPRCTACDAAGQCGGSREPRRALCMSRVGCAGLGALWRV